MFEIYNRRLALKIYQYLITVYLYTINVVLYEKHILAILSSVTVLLGLFIEKFFKNEHIN